MLFLSLFVTGIGVGIVAVLAAAIFVSVAFESPTDSQHRTGVDGCYFEASDSRVLQVLRDAHGDPVVASTRQFHARPTCFTRP